MLLLILLFAAVWYITNDIRKSLLACAAAVAISWLLNAPLIETYPTCYTSAQYDQCYNNCMPTGSTQDECKRVCERSAGCTPENNY